MPGREQGSGRSRGAPGAAESSALGAIAMEERYLAWQRRPRRNWWGGRRNLPRCSGRRSFLRRRSSAMHWHCSHRQTHRIYLWIAPGTFEMGSTDEQCRRAGLDECYAEEQPPHTVEVGGYWLQRTEVSNEQYKRCAERGGCSEPHNNYWELPQWARHPVTWVDWHQASAYSTWAGGRLPLEEPNGSMPAAAAKARLYPWGDEAPTAARLNYNNEVDSATEVGRYLRLDKRLVRYGGQRSGMDARSVRRRLCVTAADERTAGAVVIDWRALRGGAWNDDSADARCCSSLRHYP